MVTCSLLATDEVLLWARELTQRRNVPLLFVLAVGVLEQRIDGRDDVSRLLGQSCQCR